MEVLAFGNLLIIAVIVVHYLFGTNRLAHFSWVLIKALKSDGDKTKRPTTQKNH